MFSRSGGHKTKETYPTRPGSPTPCKQVLSNSTPAELAYIWKGNWIGIIAVRTERTRIRDVFAAVAVLKS